MVTDNSNQEQNVPLTEQEEKDKQRNESTVIRKAEAIRLVENHFGEAIKRLKNRTPQDQNVIGNCITVLEGELLKELKALTEFQKP